MTIAFNVAKVIDNNVQDLEDEECEHWESENGICNDCGDEVDWVERMFKETEKD